MPADRSGTLVLSAHQKGQLPRVGATRIGAGLVFERLWKECGCKSAVERALRGRKFSFAVERALFLTVVHRLMVSGSDRSAAKWHRGHSLEGTKGLALHHLYRAMAWLGEPLPEQEQKGRTPFAPRCTKDPVEEDLFAHRRDLLTTLDLVFFDTTSIYFEGQGGLTLGQHGHSKDSRPDLKQMVVLRKELQDRLEAQGEKLEWADVIRDLDALEDVEVEQDDKRFRLRTEARGTCGVVFRAAGVALPPTVRQLPKPRLPPDLFDEVRAGECSAKADV